MALTPEQQRQITRRARRDVRIEQRPLLRGIRKAKQQTRRAHTALINELQPLGGQLQAQLNALGGQFSQQLGGLSGLLGSIGLSGQQLANAGLTAPQGELLGGAGVFGALGSGGFGALAGIGARNAAYQTSAQRQAAIDRFATLRDLTQQRLDVLRDRPSLIRQRVDELRDVAEQIRLAELELALRRAIARQQFDLGSRAIESELAASRALAKTVRGQARAARGKRKKA